MPHNYRFILTPNKQYVDILISILTIIAALIKLTDHYNIKFCMYMTLCFSQLHNWESVSEPHTCDFNALYIYVIYLYLYNIYIILLYKYIYIS